MTDIKNMTQQQLLVRCGRLYKKIAKLQEQRDAARKQVAHYRHVLDVSPFIESRFRRYEDIKAEQKFRKDIEARVVEQAALIKELTRRLDCSAEPAKD